MKQIILWIFFGSLSLGYASEREEKIVEYNMKSLYHVYTKEYGLALEYAKLACRMGSGESCSNIALMYVNGFINGKVYYFKAHQYYKKACALKNASACTSAGMFYEEGLGLNTVYVESAKPYYIEGCQLGSGQACNSLGVIAYKEGHLKKAIELYLKSCTKTFGLGCYNYAYALERGQGVKEDFKQAVFYYIKGCKLDVGVSCSSASHMIYRGNGIRENKSLSKEYLEKACILKHKPSCVLRKKLFKSNN